MRQRRDALGPAAPARDFCWQNYSIKEGEIDRSCLLWGMGAMGARDTLA